MVRRTELEVALLTASDEVVWIQSLNPVVQQCLQRHLLEILVHRAAVVAYVCNHNTKRIMDKVQCP